MRKADQEIIQLLREQLALIQAHIWDMQRHIDAIDEALRGVGRGHLNIDTLREIIVHRLRNTTGAKDDAEHSQMQDL